MKKLLFLIALFVTTTLSAQFPFPVSGQFINLNITGKLAINTPYSGTTAKLHIKGSTNTSASSTIYLEDVLGSMYLTTFDDGSTVLRPDANVRYVFGGSSTLSFTDDLGIIRDQTFQGSKFIWSYGRNSVSNVTLSPASSLGNYYYEIAVTGSDGGGGGGSTALKVFNIIPTWNLSAGSTCDVIGIDYNPTVTLVNSPGVHYAALFRSGRVGVGTGTPASSFEVNGSAGFGISTITTNTTLNETYYTVLVDCTAGNVTVTLPPVATTGKRVYIIKKIDVSANTITIDANGAELIDGAATKTISNQYAFYTIQSNTSAWYIIGNN